MCSKIFYTILLLLIQQHLAAQTLVKGIVKDKSTGEPLAFCSIGVLGQNKGCISNEEGGFELNLNLQKDTLRFHYLGYQPLTIPASALIQSKIVKLQEATNQLEEVEIFADNDYLYDLLGKCRNQLKEAPLSVAKVYFSLDTEIAGRPVEMLESYYNGVIEGSQIRDIRLKSGRIGLAEQDNGHLFISINTSEALRMVNLIEGSDYLPDIPLEYTPNKLRKAFKLTRKNSGDSTLYRIGFEPKISKKGFEGEIWLDKDSRAIRKIQLSLDSCAVHPFETLRKTDSLLFVSLDITQTYTSTRKGSQLSYTGFGYEIHYLNRNEDGSFDLSPKVAYTTGRMYCYDYNNLFSLPIFEFNSGPFVHLGDYYKISNMPYNPSFWENNIGLLHTERQESMLLFIEKHGKLLNFNQKMKHNKPEEGFFFEYNNIFWSDTSRMYLRKPNNTEFHPDRVKLSAQIFLDLNEDQDTLRHFSATVLDVHQSYFVSDNPDQAACVINIYFDLCEIERRAMEQKIKEQNADRPKILKIHEKSTQNLQILAKEYLKKTDNGNNINELRKWNTIIKSELGIDNFKLFRIE
jgi:hypothetical protein